MHYENIRRNNAERKELGVVNLTSFALSWMSSGEYSLLF